MIVPTKISSAENPKELGRECRGLGRRLYPWGSEDLLQTSSDDQADDDDDDVAYREADEEIIVRRQAVTTRHDRHHRLRPSAVGAPCAQTFGEPYSLRQHQPNYVFRDLTSLKWLNQNGPRSNLARGPSKRDESGRRL